MVLDPLNGIEVIQKGIITPIHYENPLGGNVFSVFSFFKTSAKASMRLDDSIVNYIKSNHAQIKVSLS